MSIIIIQGNANILAQVCINFGGCMLPVVTVYPNSNTKSYNFTLIVPHHFIMFIGDLETNDATHYKVSLWCLIGNTTVGKLI